MKFKYGDKVKYTGDTYPHLKGTVGVVTSGGVAYNRSGVTKEHVEVVFDQNTSIFLHDTELNDLSLSQTFKHTNPSQAQATWAPVYNFQFQVQPDSLDTVEVPPRVQLNKIIQDALHTHKKKTYVGLTGLNQYDYCEECGEKM